MIHVKHIRGPNRWKGLNPLKVLANTIKYDKAVQEFSLTEMEKKESFILGYGANVDAEKQKKLLAILGGFIKKMAVFCLKNQA